MKVRSGLLTPLAIAVVFTACGRHDHDDDHGHSHGREPAAAEAAEPWAVTAWGNLYELFPETDPLVAGQASASHTHVTILSGFAPLKEGRVEAVLRAGGQEHVFAGTFKRDGIFDVQVKPPREGVYDLAYRIDAAAGREEVPAGKVRVGSAEEPGGLTATPAPPHGTASAEGADEISFLKEQQWRTEFATEWVREGDVTASARGTAKVRPAAGGEVILTAPVDAVLAHEPWPHPGQAVARGAAVFRLQPSVDATRSLAELTADEAALAAEAGAADARAERLQRLLELEAVSRAEAERAEAAAAGLKARLDAARRDLAAARAARTGGRAASALAVDAPWTGVVASVDVSPGQAVSAGRPLGRLVKASPVWLELALRPEDAARVAGPIEGVALRRPGDAQPHVVSAADVRVVSRAAEVDARSGTRSVLLELRRDADVLPIGSVVEAEVLLPGGERGVVIPATALVDDGGTTVVYVQLSGEGFVRREVHVTGRAGGDVAVVGLEPGERLVTRGGASIRRATLLSTGAPEGHVH